MSLEELRAMYAAATQAMRNYNVAKAELRLREIQADQYEAQFNLALARYEAELNIPHGYNLDFYGTGTIRETALCEKKFKEV